MDTRCRQPGPGASAARRAAADVLVRVWEEGAWAAPALDAEIGRRGLDARDGGLAGEIVYGVLRTGPWLEARIGALSARTGWRKRARVRAHVLAGAYQILLLERVPAFAAVDETVEALKSVADARVAGFANAVLRKLARARAREGGERPARLGAAALASVPAWLRTALGEALGGDAESDAFLTAGPIPPPVGLCLGAQAARERDAWIARLREAAPGAEITAGACSPRALRVSGAGPVRELVGAGRAWAVQEEGAQLAALALGARAGERVLDACAGRGNKTLLLAEQVGPGGAVHAADNVPLKLRQLEAAARERGVAVAACHAVDWTRGAGDVPADFDRALVDAPCTGVGTLRRRPEIIGRLAADDVVRLATLGRRIARRVAEHVRDGGRLVYAVCTVLRPECEGVLEALAEPPGAGEGGTRLYPAPFDDEIARRFAGDAPALRLLPHVHGTDGYFLASFLVRRR